MGYIFLLIYIAAIFIRPHEWNVAGAESPIIRISILLTFLTYLVAQKNKVMAPQYLLMIGLAFVIAMSSILNGWAGGAIHQNIGFLPSSMLPLIVCGGLITSANKQIGVMIVCLIACMFMVHNGHSQHSHPDGLGWAAGTKLVEQVRITYVGIFNDPNDIAMLLVMCMPFACYFATKSGFILKVIGIILLISLLYGVYLTNSRGGLLGVFTLIGTYFLYRYGKGKTLFAGIAALPIALIVISKFRTIEQGESANGRVESWYAGMYEFFMQNPFFGVGKGGFVEHHHLTAHNSFILIIGELGFFGYFIWLSLLALSITMVLKTAMWFKNLSQEEKNKLSNSIVKEVTLSTTLVFSFVGYLTTCFFLSRSYIIVIYVFMGMAIASHFRIIKEVPELAINDLRGFFKKSLILTLGTIIFFFIIVKILL